MTQPLTGPPPAGGAAASRPGATSTAVAPAAAPSAGPGALPHLRPGTAAAPAAPENTVDTPALLNRLQAAAAAACVLFGLVAALVQVLSWQAEGRAADNAEQVVRVQEIQSSLLRADALATNGFLVGGIEPAAERAEYDRVIADVLSATTDAAEAQPADRAALAALNNQVDAYTTAIAAARANNRQQDPVGTAYLGQAGANLRSQALPILDNLIAANQQRASDEMDGQHPYWLFATGALALVALFLVHREIARRFHRRINIGLAVAAVLVLATTLVVGLHAGARSRDNDAVRSGPYTATIDEAAARTAANNAKAYESLRLIDRGSGATNEPAWQQQAAVVQAKASASTLPLWNTYATLHQQLATADDAGNFAGARILATRPTGGTTSALDAFDSAAQHEVAATGADASSRLRKGGPLAVALAVLALLAGLLAAGAASAGINQRRREYA